MRILQINTVYKTGSTGKIAYELHQRLKSSGYNSVVYYGRGGKVVNEDAYKFANRFGVYLHVLITRVIGITGFSSNLSTAILLRAIKKYKPDVVHLHNLHGYYLNLYHVIKYLKKKSIKTIWTLHDEFMLTGMCGFSITCMNWMTGCGHCPRVSDYPKSFFLDFTRWQLQKKKKVFEGFTDLTFVTPSEWLRRQVKKSIVKEINCVVIPNGINVDRVFYPRDYQARIAEMGLSGKKLILSVVSDFFDQRKGGRHFIELANLLRKEEELHFIIIGYNDAIEKLPSNVTGIRRTENQDELALFYTAADLFVILSEIENLPTVCLESLACGTPVVGFDAGGTKETAPDTLGEFVTYGGMETLELAVRTALKKKSPEVSEECRKYAIQNYSIDKMFQKYVKLYQG